MKVVVGLNIAAVVLCLLGAGVYFDAGRPVLGTVWLVYSGIWCVTTWLNVRTMRVRQKLREDG